MKIVDICEFYAPEGGGVRTYVHAKLKAAARTGHQVVIVAPGQRDETLEFPGGCRIQMVKSPPLPFDRRYAMFWEARPIHAILDVERPDVLEASSPWRGAWIASAWQGAAVRSLFMHHDPLSAWAYRWFDGVIARDQVDRGFEWFWRYLRRMCARYALVVCAAPSLSARLAAGGIGGTLTLPMGVDGGVFSPTLRDPELRAALLARCNLAPSATLALGIGRHTPEKRWPVVIDACMLAGADRPVGLALVGDGHQRDKVLGAIGGNPHIAAIAPTRDRALLARVMASADILVHGSASETFGLVAAEARASGLPLVLPDEGAANDLADPAYAETYRTGDRRSAADAIGRMLARDPRMLRTATLAAAARARTIEDHLAELFATYAAMLDQRRAA